MKQTQSTMQELADTIASILSDDTTTNVTAALSADCGDNVQVIMLNRRPVQRHTSDVVAYDPDTGKSVVDWTEKFNRGNHEFTPGEIVAVQVFVKQAEDASVYLHIDADGRIADNFFPLHLSPEQREALLVYRGVRLGMRVRIAEVIRKEYTISDIHEYRVHLLPSVTTPLLNPTEDSLHDLAPHTAVLFEGVVKGVEKREVREYDWYKPLKGFLQLELDDGREVEIPHHSTEITIDDGVLENLRGKTVIHGERIRITAYVTKEHGIHAGYSYAFLLVPAKKRQEEYEKLRLFVRTQLQALESMIVCGDYVSARRSIAGLRHQELTHAESALVLNAVEDMPAVEKPLLQRCIWNARRIDAAYQVYVESMTRQEFLGFADAVASGDLVAFGPHCDASYVFGFLKDATYETDTQYEIIERSLGRRLQRLNDAVDHHDVYFDEEYVAEQAMAYLAYLDDPRAAVTLEKVILLCVNCGYFSTAQRRCPSKYDMLLDKAIECLTRLVRNHSHFLEELNRGALDEARVQLVADEKSARHAEAIGVIFKRANHTNA